MSVNLDVLRVGNQTLVNRNSLVAQTRKIFSSFARGDDLAATIATALREGKKVVLLDAPYDASLREQVIKLGISPAKADEVINIDHHNEKFGMKTATELVLERIKELREIKGDIQLVINHGDTDAILSAYIVQNLDREFSAEQVALLKAAVRSGDHFEGDIESDAVRLDLAIGSLCYASKLFHWQEPTVEEISAGVSKSLDLVHRVLEDRKALFLPENQKLWEEELTKLISSRDAVDKRSEGIEIIEDIPGFPIVVVDVEKVKGFNPRGAYAAQIKPAVFVAAVEGGARGIGRNWQYSIWLPLNKGGFYSLEGISGSIRGGDHAGGLIKGSTMPTRETFVNAVLSFLKDRIGIDPAPAVATAGLTPGLVTDLVSRLTPQYSDRDLYRKMYDGMAVQYFGNDHDDVRGAVSYTHHTWQLDMEKARYAGYEEPEAPEVRFAAALRYFGQKQNG